jgi:hypothetical protein
VGSFKNLFSRTIGPILTRLGTNHPWGRGFKFVQMKGIAPLQGEIIAKQIHTLKYFFENLLLQNLQAEFNQT